MNEKYVEERVGLYTEKNCYMKRLLKKFWIS